MTTVTGYTSQHMDLIKNSNIVGGHVEDANLVLDRFDGSDIIVGEVGGPPGPDGPTGSSSTSNVYTRYTTSHTLTSGDVGMFIEMDSASANYLTIPVDTSELIPIGTIINGIQRGVGTTGFIASSGVDLLVFAGYANCAGQYARFKLERVSLTEWYLSGNLTY